MMKYFMRAMGTIVAVISLQSFAEPPHSLAPGVATVYANARAGTLKTTDAKGKPRREPLGPRFNGMGQVEVDVHYQATAPIDAFKALGAAIEASVPALSTVELFIAPAKLAQIARLPAVSRIGFPHYTLPNGTSNTVSTSAASVAIDARAKQVMHVDELTQAIRALGKGINVLVVSVGADHIAEAAKAGALPSAKSIWVDSTVAGKGDEGTAMLEIVHAVAPNAALGFCGPQTGVQDFVCL